MAVLRREGSMSAPEDNCGDTIGERIMQNEELVERILESAGELSEPMTLEAFREWLRGVGNEPSP
jgi:hypothetical protein